MLPYGTIRRKSCSPLKGQRTEGSDSWPSNSGKTQIYNNLTGTYNLVANYHHTTIDVNRAYYEHGGLLYELYDVPGLYCLYANSEEELLVRNLIFSEEPDVLLFCLDANLLKQSLMLGIELMELGIPMVIALNAIDETSKKGFGLIPPFFPLHLGFRL